MMDTKELTKWAEKANRWYYDSNQTPFYNDADGQSRGGDDDGTYSLFGEPIVFDDEEQEPFVLSARCSEADAKFIAAANPATILALLARVADLTEACDIAVKLQNDAQSDAERAEKRVAELESECKSLSDMVSAQDKGLAELEARTVTVPEGWSATMHSDGRIFFKRPDDMLATIAPGEPLGSHGDTLHMLMSALATAAPAAPAQPVPEPLSDDEIDALCYPPRAQLKRQDWDAATRKPKAQPVPAAAAQDSPAIKDERLFEIVSLMNEAWKLDDGGMCARTAFEELCEFIDARVARLATPIAQPVAAPVVREPLTWVSVDERLPEVSVPVLVYAPPQPGDWPGSIRIELDCIDENDDSHSTWHGHNEHYEHFCCVAKPEGSIGPSEKAPYTHWMPIPELPPAPTGASHDPD